MKIQSRAFGTGLFPIVPGGTNFPGFVLSRFNSYHFYDPLQHFNTQPRRLVARSPAKAEASERRRGSTLYRFRVQRQWENLGDLADEMDF